jgi:hypothetical protein
MSMPLILLVVAMLSLCGITLTTEYYVAEEQAAQSTAQDRATADAVIQAQILATARATIATYMNTAGHTIDGAPIAAAFNGLTLSDPCPTCTEVASISFLAQSAYPGTTLAAAPGVTGTTTVTQNEATDEATIGSVAQAVDSRWNVQATVVLTPRGGAGVVTTRVENIVIRGYGQAPYADIAGDDQARGATTMAGDVSSQLVSGSAGSVDTTVHVYDTCSDSSDSGACANYGTPPNSLGTPVPSTGQGQAANSSW